MDSLSLVEAEDVPIKLIRDRRGLSSMLVALAAIVLGAFTWMDRRARHFRRVAMDYRDMAKLDEIQAAFGSRRNGAIAAYRRTLQRKYEHAAAHPWLPFGPEPATAGVPGLIATCRRAAPSESE